MKHSINQEQNYDLHKLLQIKDKIIKNINKLVLDTIDIPNEIAKYNGVIFDYLDDIDLLDKNFSKEDRKNMIKTIRLRLKTRKFSFQSIILDALIEQTVDIIINTIIQQ